MNMLFTITLVSLLVNVVTIMFFIGSNKKNKTLLIDIEKLNEALKKQTKKENEKTEIRERYDEKENDIDNNPGLNGVMPVEQEPKHNHKFGSPCGKGCPAFPGD